jgi:hypothetical protein
VVSRKKIAAAGSLARYGLVCVLSYNPYPMGHSHVLSHGIVQGLIQKCFGGGDFTFLHVEFSKFVVAMPTCFRIVGRRGVPLGSWVILKVSYWEKAVSLRGGSRKMKRGGGGLFCTSHTH